MPQILCNGEYFRACARGSSLALSCSIVVPFVLQPRVLQDLSVLSSADSQSLLTYQNWSCDLLEYEGRRSD